MWITSIFVFIGLVTIGKFLIFHWYFIKIDFLTGPLIRTIVILNYLIRRSITNQWWPERIWLLQRSWCSRIMRWAMPQGLERIEIKKSLGNSERLFKSWNRYKEMSSTRRAKDERYLNNLTQIFTKYFGSNFSFCNVLDYERVSRFYTAVPSLDTSFILFA